MIDNPRDFGKELLPTCLGGRGSARPLDQFDLVSIGSVNEDEAATRRTCGRAVGDADDLFIGEPAGFGDDRVLPPLVLGAATPSRPKDEDLAVSRWKSRLEENVVGEDQPSLEQLRVIDEGPKDLIGRAEGCPTKQLARLVVENRLARHQMYERFG